MGTDRKDAVLRRILKDRCCTKSRLMNFCGVNAEQAATLCRELAQEGKIKIWPGIREGAFFASVPDHPGPGKAARPASPPKRIGRLSGRKVSGSGISPSDEGGKPEAGSLPPKNGGGRTQPPAVAVRFGPGHPAYDAALAELERRRDLINHSIDALRALA